MTRLARRTLCAALLAAALPFVCQPLAATAAPVDDYFAVRDKAIATALAAANAGKNGDDDVIKAEEAARQDLAKRMSALVGPLKLKGLGNPTYTLDVFVYGDDLGTTQLDGMALTDKNETTRVVVTPEPVLQAWLTARAKDKDAPAAARGGLKALPNTAYLVNNSIVNPGGGFIPYTALAVTAAPGETAYANLGLYTDEAPADTPPNTIVVVRVADGRAVLGMMPVTLDAKVPAVCTQVWKPYDVKIQALLKATETVSDLEDPRFAELSKLEEEGAAAFQACFAKAPESQAALAAATKRAEAFLDTLRGR
ncbi:hypothetical protein [Xanthobacter variabilis]|uniref:hypothetical protein n=1 Tax=Xanthobacter variabilis TaxID=3119932 RepID=UPI00374F54DD